MQHLPLVEKIVVSEDTRIFRFGLPRSDMRLGLPTGNHMFLRANVDGHAVMRPYTPMTDDDTRGHVDLLVKVFLSVFLFLSLCSEPKQSHMSYITILRGLMCG